MRRAEKKYRKKFCEVRINCTQFRREICVGSSWLNTVKVKLSLFLTNQARRHEDVWVSGCIDPRFLDLSSSCRWVFIFSYLPLYPRGKSAGAHCRGSYLGPRAYLDNVNRRQMLPLSGLELRPLCRPASSQWSYRLSYRSFFFLYLDWSYSLVCFLSELILKILKCYTQPVGLLGWVVSPSQGYYLHRIS
jgi:hypothetical protein